MECDENAPERCQIPEGVTKMSCWRMGLIGCGWAGSKHAQALLALTGRAELCGLADLDPQVAARCAATWLVPRWTVDYRELLARARLDAVIIALPHHLHAPVAIAAAQVGLHLLVEKPLATTLAEADAMIEAASRNGVCLMVAENVRFDATYRQVAQTLEAGALGELLLVRISREHQMRDYLRARPWFLEQPSGGILASGGVHDFELVRMLAGEIEHVYALTPRKAFPEMVADDTGVVLAGLQSGAAAVLVESFAIRTPAPGVQGAVHGTQGSLWFGGETIRLYRADQDGRQEAVETIAVPTRDTFQAELAHFLDCLDSGAVPITSGEEERKPLAALLAAYESVRTGARVYLA
jgi:predicted dehydrogenase